MSSWRQAAGALALDQHKPLLRRPEKKDRSSWLKALKERPEANPRPAMFEDDQKRYEWERIQHRWFKHPRRRYWQDANGLFVLGPPIPPGAVVVEHMSAIAGFKRANELGFWPAWPVCQRVLGIEKPVMAHRWEMAKLADSRPELIRCIVRHPHLNLEKGFKHCRFYDEHEMGAAFAEWVRGRDLRREQREERKRLKAERAKKRKRFQPRRGWTGPKG